MNYNEREVDPQGGVAQDPRVGTEAGDPRRFRETIGVLRSIPDAQGPGQLDRERGHDKIPPEESGKRRSRKAFREDHGSLGKIR